jgi:hypothetical protein
MGKDQQCGRAARPATPTMDRVDRTQSRRRPKAASRSGARSPATGSRKAVLPRGLDDEDDRTLYELALSSTGPFLAHVIRIAFAAHHQRPQLLSSLRRILRVLTTDPEPIGTRPGRPRVGVAAASTTRSRLNSHAVEEQRQHDE